MEEEAAGLLNQIWKDIITFSVFLVKKRRTTKNRCRELAEISENLLANYCPCIPPRGNHISHLNFYFQIERKYRGGWKTIRSEKAIVSLLMLGVIINDLAFGKNEGCMLLQLILREKVVRPGLPRCRDAVMSDSWTSGRSGVGLAAYEAER